MTRSLHILDPDGHEIELHIEVRRRPDGKTHSRSSRPSGRSGFDGVPAPAAPAYLKGRCIGGARGWRRMRRSQITLDAEGVGHELREFWAD